MKILLDTHIFLWCLNDSQALSIAGRELIQSATEVYVSSASIWEIAIKIKLKKLEGNLEKIVKALNESGFQELPITIRHMAQTALLPTLHRDPFDRILVAQAVTEPLHLVTADTMLTGYSDMIMLI